MRQTTTARAGARYRLGRWALMLLILGPWTAGSATALTLGMVTSHDGRIVVVFDADTDTVLATLSYPVTVRFPVDCSILPDQSFGFVPNFGLQTYVVDTKAPPIRFGSQIGTSHQGLDSALSTDGKFLLECGGSRNQDLLTINTETMTVARRRLSDCTAVDVCADGTVLTVTQPGNRIERFLLQADGSVVFQNSTREIDGPFNIVCAPDSSTAVVIRQPTGWMHALSLPDLEITDSRQLSATAGNSGVFHPDGDRFYARSGSPSNPVGSAVEAFSYDATAGRFGASPLFKIFADPPRAFFGADQLAVHPNGRKLYLSEAFLTRVHDADTGAFLDFIPVSGNPSGVCLPSRLLEGNRAPRADAGADRTIECSGDLAGSLRLDGSASGDFDSTPGTNDDIVTFEWLGTLIGQPTTALGFGELLDASLPFGRNVVELIVHDTAGNTDGDKMIVRVEDFTRPTVTITAPTEGSCHGPAALPVVVETDTFDICDPQLEITYSPPLGPAYETHGNRNVTVRVEDEARNIGFDTVRFTIDTIAPAVEIFEPAGQSVLLPTSLPFSIVFDAQDADGATGDVVHEVALLDGCVAYDGFVFGDGDGRLIDETLFVDMSELCRIGAACGVTEFVRPVLTIAATDCGGNVGTAAEQLEGTVLLGLENCPN